ncbi:MAG: hypothetical protein M5U34_19915 [Chloroflexi bacterium]|nr:hypothetical protein [Chloroflexota bacterium]
MRIVCIREPDEVMAALREVETAVFTQNLYAAGFLSYEASAAFGLAVHPAPDDAPPLLWFGLYEQPIQTPALANRLSVGYRLGQWQGAVGPDVIRREYRTHQSANRSRLCTTRLTTRFR